MYNDTCIWVINRPTCRLLKIISDKFYVSSYYCPVISSINHLNVISCMLVKTVKIKKGKFYFHTY